MNRRSFLSSLFATATATVLAPFIPKPKPKLDKLEFVGKFPVRQDLSCIPSKYQVGWVIYEEIGVVLINDYAIAKVTLS